MSLREDFKNYVPMYLWENIEHPEGYIVFNEEYNARWNLLQTQGDQQANAIRDILQMLYETVLHDEDGASHIKINMDEYAADNLKGTLLLIDQRLKVDAQALATHKASADHDSRYYTKDELNTGQLDNRYYTKTDLIPWLRGGDTSIKEEVYTIISSDNGDGTFTYSDGIEQFVEPLTSEGYQVFTLREGFYELGSNRVELIVGDTLRRSVKSGGLIEVDSTHVALTQPEGAGAEITIKYYERIGMMAEYNIKMGTIKPPLNNGRNMWFEEIVE